MDNDLWTFPDTVGRLDVAGFAVEATDGAVGKVNESSNVIGEGYLVVDTGFWKFGKTVLIPAGLVERVDRDDEKLYLAAAKDDIADAPEFREASADYRSALADHYLTRRKPSNGGAAAP